jgi:hypothetical protein
MTPAALLRRAVHMQTQGTSHGWSRFGSAGDHGSLIATLQSLPGVLV